MSISECLDVNLETFYYPRRFDAKLRASEARKLAILSQIYMTSRYKIIHQIINYAMANLKESTKKSFIDYMQEQLNATPQVPLDAVAVIGGESGLEVLYREIESSYGITKKDIEKVQQQQQQPKGKGK